MKLILGDCLEYMRTLPDNTFDLTVTSPPYDHLRTYEGTLSWNEEVWKPILQELYRVTKVGGVVVWIVGDATIKGSETGTSFKQALWAKECGFNLHDTMIYQKNNYMPLNHNRYDQEFEFMFVLTKGKPKIFNPIMQTCKTAGAHYNYATRSSATTSEKNSAMRKRNQNLVTKAEKYRGNIWSYDTGKNKGSKDNIWEHPATFPDKLAVDHIGSWSNEGDIVFDPFMGSGTTGVAALKLGRDFVGCEIVPKYYEIAKERINNRQLQL